MSISFVTFAGVNNFYPDKWLHKYRHSVQRKLADYSGYVDFASNDYLGFSKTGVVDKIFREHLNELYISGSTGSRLISGNRQWMEEIEKKIAQHHHSENALIFPSAYQANVGLFSCIANRNDLYLTDENIHASVYDGIRLSFAKHYKFKHNDWDDLKKQIERHYDSFENIFVVVESLYSMDGDSPDINELSALIDNKKVFLIVDEAHAFGIMGENNLGLFNEKNYADICAARIIGYGKAAGFSGACITGSDVLKNYLINFSRAFIFSTALPLYHYQIIEYLYDVIVHHSAQQLYQLKQNINFYLQITSSERYFSKNDSPIQYYSLNAANYQDIQNTIIQNHIFAKVILPPTVEKGKERIRISLHAFNTTEEIEHLVNTLKTFSNE
ncbi:MAG: 8-amino-7-oxononanoate synthase [Bacteroidia bacterium]|nr:MAG: 8-amino-7-oxononanoate synthase [Bacteroidia bacterium]